MVPFLTVSPVEDYIRSCIVVGGSVENGFSGMGREWLRGRRGEECVPVYVVWGEECA